MLQFLTCRIEQQDAEHLEINQPAQQFANAFQQLVEIQDRRQLAGNLVQQQQGARLACSARIELSIFNADGHARRNQRQQPLVLVGEVARIARLQIYHPNDTVLDDQWDGQLGPHVGKRIDIALFLRDIVHQHRLTQLSGAAGNALTYFHAHAFGNLARIAYMEPHAKFLGAFAEQENGENFVVDDFADELRNPP